MRTHLKISLDNTQVDRETLSPEQVLDCGRHYIAKTLTQAGVAQVDPLGPDNPLIFSAGPFAGTNFSNANRLSIGCKSPLTGGIKESNAGGNFAFAMGQLEIAAITFHGVCANWTLLHIDKTGALTFHDAQQYLGQGTFETTELLRARFGEKTAITLVGPVGERQGNLAGISITDTEGRPARLAARGGVGAVMGAKRVKAVVIELNKMPSLFERKKFMSGVKEYNRKLKDEPAIQSLKTTGTAMVADLTNHLGGLPVQNFSLGRQVDTNKDVLKMGGDYIREQNQARDGEISHACMPGCQIQCSNVYMDEQGNEVVSPLEYETIGLLGTNCGLDDPDQLAPLNWTCNDLGIDTIETGAMIGVLMEAKQAPFGDLAFMTQVLEDIRAGNERGRLYAQGTHAVGLHYNVARIPTIKKQAISAYDPRVIEATGISMMLTAQGADHTTGNLPSLATFEMNADAIVEASMQAQVLCAAADSLGLCVFGRSVTNVNLPLILDAINASMGTQLSVEFMNQLGEDTLRWENNFNEQAGFVRCDDELPAFFYQESLPPMARRARFHVADLDAALKRWWAARNAA